jgi:hypothetical protein
MLNALIIVLNASPPKNNAITAFAPSSKINLTFQYPSESIAFENCQNKTDYNLNNLIKGIFWVK